MLDRAALSKELAGFREGHEPTNPGQTEPLKISISAQPLRCGKQVRLVVGEVATGQRSVNAELVRLIVDAHRWFDDLCTGRIATIAEIAARDSQQVSHVSRTLPLSLLAPDVVAMILDGCQPSSLTQDRLHARREPLPMNWSEQRALLLG